MKIEEQLRIVLITFVITLFVFLILVFFYLDRMTLSLAKSAISIFTILTFWWGFYFNYGWKWPIMKLILLKENINGTWFGTYESKSLGDNKTYNGEISLVIKQNYLNINITSFTEKYTNYSYCEVLTQKQKNERNELVYVYSQKQISSSDHNIRKDTQELELTFSDDKAELYGKFWTNSGTIGHLRVKKIAKNYIEFFEDAKKKSEKGEKQ